jgi:hypothetical protein
MTVIMHNGTLLCRASLGALVLGALGLPSIGRADDGVLEIDQTCVAAGCFPGDIAGFPVQIVTPGSYLLTSNLVVAGGTAAISIGADDVSLDLGGFEVSGPVNCQIAPFDIVCQGATNASAIEAAASGTVVRNGSVRGFSEGGSLGCVAVTAGRVEELAVSECSGVGIGVGEGVVRRNVVRGIGGTGINASGVVADNRVSFTGGAGIVGFGSVIGNDVRLTAANGMTVQGTATGNSVDQTGQGAPGIVCSGLCSVTHNTVLDCGEIGILLIGGSVATLIGNVVTDCVGVGIHSTTGASAGYGANNLHDNNSGGAQVAGAGALVQISTNVCQGDSVCP